MTYVTKLKDVVGFEIINFIKYNVKGGSSK
jgi:hypothetical protein